MSNLWDEMRALLQEYVDFFSGNPAAPVTADRTLYKRLTAFAQRAKVENHPAAAEVMELAGGRYITLRPLEAVRILANLKQRKSVRDTGRELVDQIQFDLRPRSYPVRNVTAADLPPSLQTVADLAGYPSYSGFQVRSWERILDAVETSQTVMLTAPTGAGKTEAFMLPLVQAAQDDRHFIIIYPRRELIKDQVGRLVKAVHLANQDRPASDKPLIIGIQLGGIQHLLQDVLWPEDDSMLRVRCTECGELLNQIRTDSWACGCQNKYLPPYYWTAPNWWFDNRQKKWQRRRGAFDNSPSYLGHLESLVVEWPGVLTCPACDDGTAMQATAKQFFTADGGGKSGSKGDTHPVQFACPRCGCSVPFSLSKEHHLRVKPHFLVTNVESLDKLLLDPRYEQDGYFKGIDGVALDEVHVYHTLYGAHVHHLLQRLQRHRGEVCTLIGCSATIPEPADFGQRLFGRQVAHLVEANDPAFPQESPSAEYFLFLRVPDDDTVAALSTLLQSVMALGHAVLPAEPKPISGTQVMVFSDSLDVIIRAEHQLMDAERGQLYNFRLEDKVQGPWECVGLDRDRCPYLPDGSICPTYAAGECWRLFWNGEVRGEPLEITSVHAQQKRGMQEAREADVIISSPTLEVGVDLPTVGATVHYKTPRAVFSFIQRKGRAGRRPGQFPFTVAVLAGNDPMDAFYFQQFRRLVAGQYQLPLNPENPVIQRIHEEYLDGSFNDRIMDVYEDLLNKPEFQRFPQKALRPTGWTVVRDLASCDRWINEVGLGLPAALERGEGLELAVKNMQALIKKKEARIDELAARYGRKLEDRTALTEELNAALAALSSRIPEPVKLLPQFTDLWTEAEESAGNLDREVAAAESMAQVKEKIAALLEELNDTLSRIRSLLLKQPGNTTAAREALREVTANADGLIDAIENQGLLAYGDEVSDLRYQVAALDKLLETAKSRAKLPSEIVKRYQQAQFYLCWSCKQWNTCKLPQRMEYFVPETYFDSPANLLVALGNGLHEEAAYMLHSTYVPYKIFYRFGQEPITVHSTSRPAGTSLDGTPEVDVRFDGMQGIWDVHDGQPYFMPRRIEATCIEPQVIPQAGNRYRICPACFNLALDCEPRCKSCDSQTVLASIYATPVVERRFVVRERLKGAKRLSLCVIDGLTQVIAADVSYKRQGGSQPINFRARYVQPLGYRYETRGLVLDLAEVVEKAWQAYNQPAACAEKHVQRAAELAQGLWPPTNPSRDTFSQTIMHTAAHMLLKTVASMCGVNEESLEYAWNTQSGEVAVWEKYTGGAGISDLLMEYVQTAIADVYQAIVNSVGCRSCDSEDADGCPDCVWISYCQAGKRDQAAAVSQSLGALLLACLTRRVPLHAGTTADDLRTAGGPLLVDVVDGNTTAICLDL